MICERVIKSGFHMFSHVFTLPEGKHGKALGQSLVSSKMSIGLLVPQCSLHSYTILHLVFLYFPASRTGKSGGRLTKVSRSATSWHILSHHMHTGHISSYLVTWVMGPTFTETFFEAPPAPSARRTLQGKISGPLSPLSQTLQLIRWLCNCPAMIWLTLLWGLLKHIETGVPSRSDLHMRVVGAMPNHRKFKMESNEEKELKVQNNFRLNTIVHYSFKTYGRNIVLAWTLVSQLNLHPTCKSHVSPGKCWFSK